MEMCYEACLNNTRTSLKFHLCISLRVLGSDAFAEYQATPAQRIIRQRKTSGITTRAVRDTSDWRRGRTSEGAHLKHRVVTGLP